MDVPRKHPSIRRPEEGRLLGTSGRCHRIIRGSVDRGSIALRQSGGYTSTLFQMSSWPSLARSASTGSQLRSLEPGLSSVSWCVGTMVPVGTGTPFAKLAASARYPLTTSFSLDKAVSSVDETRNQHDAARDTATAQRFSSTPRVKRLRRRAKPAGAGRFDAKVRARQFP